MDRPELDAELSPHTRELLEQYGFDLATFEELRARLRDRGPAAAQNHVTGRIEPPRTGDIIPLPPLGSAERNALDARGRELIGQGAVAGLVLCGGMATRFGGVVKASVQVAEGKTFLDLKLRDIEQVARSCGGRVPVCLMTSFATHAEVTRAARVRSSDVMPVHTFAQFISLRLTPEGELFRGDDGEPSPYAPGHGDLVPALRASGTLSKLAAAGVKHLFMSNVDNLAATLDPAVIGLHALADKRMSFEVAATEPGDKGGAPVRVDGKLQVIEAFRFPDEFDQARVPLFSTNSFVLDLSALDRSFDLSWFVVSKRVDGRVTIQFERLVNQLSAFLDCQGIGIAREGHDGRFMPVKDPDELEARRASIVRLLRERGAL